MPHQPIKVSDMNEKEIKSKTTENVEVITAEEMQKIIAAKRQGIKELIMPEANKDDFEEVPDHIREGMTVHFCKKFNQVAKILL